MTRRKTDTLGMSPSKDARASATTPMASQPKPLRRSVAVVVALALVLGCVLAVFWSFLAGGRTFLFRDIGSDSTLANYPAVCQSAHYLRQYGVTGWSAHQGMGQAFLPSGDPFFWPLFSLGGLDSIAKAIGVMEAFKCLLAMALFGAFLRCTGVGRLPSIVGTLLYGFSGYLILGSCWNVFSTEAVYLAFLLLATERFIRYGSIWLTPVPICLLGMLQPFYYFGFGLFTLAYLLLRRAERRLTEPCLAQVAAPTAPKRAGLLVQEGRLVLSFGALCGVGVLMSGGFLLSSLDLIRQSPRVGGEASYAGTLMSQPLLRLSTGGHELASAILRTFSPDMIGSGSGFTGWQNYLESPLFYCGLISLLLVPQLFVLCRKRLRGLYATALVLALVPTLFPWIRHAFWLFQGDYYRLYSLLVTTTLILLSVRALALLNAGGRINLALLAATLAVCLVALSIPHAERFVPGTLKNTDIEISFAPAASPGQLVVNQPLRNVAMGLLVAYALLLACWSWSNAPTPANRQLRRAESRTRAPSPAWIQGFLLAMVVGEAVGFARITLNDRPVVTKPELTQKTGFNDFTVDALAAIRKADPDPFYRVNKDYASGPAMHASLNDAMVQDYYGTTSYAQFNQLHYIRFLDAMGVLDARGEHQTRWCLGLVSRPLLQIWASTRYCLTKNPAPYRKAGDLYEDIGTWGNVTAFRFRHTLPLGFCYDQYIPRALFGTLDSADKDNLLLQAVVVDPPDERAVTALSRFSPRAAATAFDPAPYVERLGQTPLVLDAFRPDRLQGHVTADTRKLLFFSIPFDRGWRASVDGKPADLLKVNIGFLGLMLEPGRHEIALRYRPPMLLPGLVVSCVGLAAYFILLFFRRRIASWASAYPLPSSKPL